MDERTMRMVQALTASRLAALVLQLEASGFVMSGPIHHALRAAIADGLLVGLLLARQTQVPRLFEPSAN